MTMMLTTSTVNPTVTEIATITSKLSSAVGMFSGEKIVCDIERILRLINVVCAG